MGVFVASYATVEDLEHELGNPDVSVDSLSCPRFSGVFARHEVALSRTKAAVLEGFRRDYLSEAGGWDYEGAEAAFAKRYGGGTWIDGEWVHPEQGRPGSVHRYVKRGDLLAVVTVQWAEIEE